MLHRVLLLTLLLPANPLASDDPFDIRWVKNFDFTIKLDKQKGYSVSAEIEYRQVFLTDRSDDYRRFLIYEPSMSHVSHIRTALKGMSYKGDYVWSQAADDRDVFLTDSKVHFVTFSEKFKPGDSLGYSYREEFDDINYLPLIYIMNRNQMRNMRITFAHPVGMTINAELFAPRHNVSLRTDRSDPKRTILTIDSLSEIEPLPFFAFNKFHAAILLTVANQGQPVSISNPSDFVRWYTTHTDLRPTLDSASWHLLDTMVADTATELVKLEAIHNWVCGQIRYIADLTKQHSIFPHRPSEVLAVRYGDCKDRAGLVAAFARRYGIDVYLGLVSSEFEPPFTGISLWEFDHVVCVYAARDSVVVFDPTARLHPFGVLPDGIIGHPVFVLDPDNPRWVKLQRSESPPDIKICMTGNLDSLAHVDATLDVRGEHLAAIRSILKEQVGASKERIISDVVSAPLAGIPMSNFVMTGDGSRNMSFACRADLSRFVIASSATHYLLVLPFRQLSPRIQDRANDTLPVYLDTLQNLALTIKLRAPGMTLSSDSISFSDSSGTRFIATARPGNADTLIFSYATVRWEKVFAGAAKASFLNFCRKFQSAAAEVFTIKEIGQ